jgi:hypothetical protein
MLLSFICVSKFPSSMCLILIVYSRALPPKRPNKMSFNSFTERCISEIEANPICEADSMLVCCLMLQRLSEEALATTPMVYITKPYNPDASLFENSISVFNSRYQNLLISNLCTTQNHRMHSLTIS